MMLSYRKRLFSAVFSWLLVLFAVFINCFSQNELGSRNLNKVLLQSFGSWADSTTPINITSRQPYPLIKSIPPLSLGMPLDVLFGYIALDSLLRNASAHAIDSTLTSYLSLNDTLKWTISGYLRLQDYNPLLLHQFGIETRNHGPATNRNFKLDTNGVNVPLYDYSSHRYKSSVSWLEQLLFNRMLQLHPEANHGSRLLSCLFPDYILHVQILSVDTIFVLNYVYASDDSLMSNPVLDTAELDFRVRALVLDTIKGKWYRSIPCLDLPTSFESGKPNSPRSKSAKSATTLDHPCPVIEFTYQQNFYNLAIREDYGDSGKVPSPEFIDSAGYFILTPTQEAIVFLKLGDDRLSYTHDYIKTYITPVAAYGPIPINNGTAHDINRVWSLSEYLSYSSIRSAIRGLIDGMIKREY